MWARTTGHTACAGGHPPDAADLHRLRARRSRPTFRTRRSPQGGTGPSGPVGGGRSLPRARHTTFGVGPNHRTHRLRRRASPRRGRSSPPARPEVAPHPFAHADRLKVGRALRARRRRAPPATSPSTSFGVGPNHRTHRLRRRASPRRGRSSPPARPEVAPHLSHTPIASRWDGPSGPVGGGRSLPRARPRLLVWARTTGHTACAGGHPPDAADLHRLRARRSRPTFRTRRSPQGGTGPPGPSAAGAPCHEPVHDFWCGPEPQDTPLEQAGIPPRGRSSPPARPEVAPHPLHAPPTRSDGFFKKDVRSSLREEVRGVTGRERPG